MAIHCAATKGDLGKERLKIWVFRRFLKTVSDGVDVTFCGSAATGKARI